MFNPVGEKPWKVYRTVKFSDKPGFAGRYQNYRSAHQAVEHEMRARLLVFPWLTAEIHGPQGQLVAFEWDDDEERMIQCGKLSPAA